MSRILKLIAASIAASMVLSLIAVGGAVATDAEPKEFEGEEVEYDREAPENATQGETLEITVETVDPGYIVENVDDRLTDLEVVSDTAVRAGTNETDSVVVAWNWEEQFEVTYSVTVPENATAGEYTIDSRFADGPSDTIVVDGALEAYMNEGEVDTELLRDAIDDWHEGKISTELLRDVIAEWRS